MKSSFVIFVLAVAISPSAFGVVFRKSPSATAPQPLFKLGLDHDRVTAVMYEVRNHTVGKQDPACVDIECGTLNCPPPFHAEDTGGCCPVCVSDEVQSPGYSGNGPTGDSGGTPSTVGGNCDGVWCFPPMCSAGQSPQLVGDNCCPTCEPN